MVKFAVSCRENFKNVLSLKRPIPDDVYDMFQYFIACHERFNNVVLYVKKKKLWSSFKNSINWDIIIFCFGFILVPDPTFYNFYKIIRRLADFVLFGILFCNFKPLNCERVGRVMFFWMECLFLGDKWNLKNFDFPLFLFSLDSLDLVICDLTL